MITAIIVFIILILGIAAMFLIKTIKRIIAMLFVLLVLATAGICITKPTMHKNFAISIIDYLIKFNTDGSMTTTKQTTTTTIQKGAK